MLLGLKKSKLGKRIKYRWIVDGIPTAWTIYRTCRSREECGKVFKTLLKRQEKFIEYNII